MGKLLNSSICHMDDTQAATRTPHQSGPGINSKEGALSISQSSFTGISPLDAV